MYTHTHTHVAIVRVRNTAGAESDIAGTRPTHARPPAMYIHEIICMYMHVHIYTYIHSCVHAHVHISRLFGCETHTSNTRHQTLCRHQLMLTATNTSTRLTRLPSFYVYVHTRVYMYGHTCIHIHIWIHSYIHIPSYIHVYTNIHTWQSCTCKKHSWCRQRQRCYKTYTRSTSRGKNFMVSLPMPYFSM